MALPASLLAAAESHPCFSGCYSHENPVSMIVDPSRPPVTAFFGQCQDCLMFRVGALASLLPAGMTQYGLPQELSAHMRATRGYRWAISGYHATGVGFWLSAAYYGDGLFLADAARNHSGNGGTREVDLLVQAFRSKLIHPDDSGMLDPANYGHETVHLNQSPAIGPVKTKQDILRSPQCSFQPRQGLRRVVIVEFLPMTTFVGNTGGSSKASSHGKSGAQLMSASSGQNTVPNAPPSTAPTWTAADVGKNCDRCNRQVKMITILGKTEPNCMC